MKIGLIYPQIEIAGDAKALAQIGKATEALGLDFVLMYDHVLGAIHENRDPPLWGPYTERDPFQEPLVAFAYLAAITERIQMMTGVLVLPQRQTALVAKQAADVQRLSSGRLHLGVGIGWNYVEYNGLGQDFSTRGRRCEEQIGLLRRLWTGELVEFDGRFDKIDRACLNPHPDQPIPVYCGGVSDAALRRAARIGDGFIFAGSLSQTLKDWTMLQDYLRAENRDVAGFHAQWLVMEEDFQTGLEARAGADAIRKWEEAGGTHAGIMTMGRGYKSSVQHIEHIERVLAALT